MATTRKGKGQVASKIQLAEFFGVSAPTIDHWCRMGCPAIARGGPGVAWKFSTAAVAAWREDQARAEGSGKKETGGEELKRRRLQAQTEREELALAKERDEVADIEQVERLLAGAFAEVKANMRNIPGRLVSQLIGETDEVRFKSVMLAEIDQALEALNDAELVTDEQLEIDDLDDDDEGEE